MDLLFGSPGVWVWLQSPKGQRLPPKLLIPEGPSNKTTSTGKARGPVIMGYFQYSSGLLQGRTIAFQVPQTNATNCDFLVTEALGLYPGGAWTLAGRS